MIDWGRLTLLFYILMRMSGFVLFNPLFGRSTIPGLVKSGMILTLTWAVAGFTEGTAPVPTNILQFSVILLLELALGYLLGLAMQFFFSLIPQQAGEILDNQMALTMSKEYDPASQASLSVTSTLFTVLMGLLFFANNGQVTLLRILLSSGSLVPYGQVSIGSDAINALVQLFIECAVLGLKLALPVLAAEFLGQIGMGVLMKVIPQINVFSINIELKILIGLALLLLFITPMSQFLLRAENQMLSAVEQLLTLA